MTIKSQELKWRLEQVWKSKRVACPSHLACWSEHERGWRYYDDQKTMILLYYKLGSFVGPPKKQGRVFKYMRKYGLWSKMAWDNIYKMEQCICKELHPRPFWYCPVHGEVAVDVD